MCSERIRDRPHKCSRIFLYNGLRISADSPRELKTISRGAPFRISVVLWRKYAWTDLKMLKKGQAGNVFSRAVL